VEIVEARVLSVSEANRMARSILEDGLGELWIEGEVSRATYHGSGHLYFTLSDDQAALDAVMWRSNVGRLPFRVEQGMRVQVLGSPSIYERSGRFQVMCRTIRDAGLGDLMRAYEQLKAKLSAEGLFDEGVKRPLPHLPRRVGVVTSRTGAAFADITETIHRRAPGVPILLSPALVQGERCGADVTRALTHLVACSDCDVVIVGRGGGSTEDLWGFNDEGLVRAIADCPIPVVSAVGHEVDFTLCDFVADRRAKTPTEAGELVVPDASALRREVSELADRAARATQRRIGDGHRHVADLERRMAPFHPRARVTAARDALTHLDARMRSLASARIEREQATVAALAGRLEALSPLRVLDRGYALVRDADTGAILRDAAATNPGASLSVRLARGGLSATVDSVDSAEEG
jgi:exodeoxyribonuclease VII large subunit